MGYQGIYDPSRGSRSLLNQRRLLFLCKTDVIIFFSLNHRERVWYNMVESRFGPLKSENEEGVGGGCNSGSSPNLYVANCGPAVGLSFDSIASVFSRFGEVRGVFPADDSGARVIVSYSHSSSASSAFHALDGFPCPLLAGRVLHIRYSALQPPKAVTNHDSVAVSVDASELGIPGLFLVKDFVTPEQEQGLLAAVDESPWKCLAKRRVQHYGYEFLYQTRNVDAKQFLGELPSFVSTILEKISVFSNNGVCSGTMDQLTVNEYPPGVGLAPHIDTHSAFDESIFSLSLAGPCIMELRRYPNGTWLHTTSANIDVKEESSDQCSDFIRKAIFLPPRSMLLLSGEARYAWHHYIPHHKIDMVEGNAIKRSSRRVSFTFRKVRTGPCSCEYPQYCDSQKG